MPKRKTASYKISKEAPFFKIQKFGFPIQNFVI